MIQRILNYALGTDVQQGVAQPTPNVSGLGASGLLNAGFAAPTDLASMAASVTGAEAAQSASVTSQLTTAQGLQQNFQSQLASTGSVSIDAQMSLMVVLQNAYAANGRVIGAVQSMWDQLLQAVQT
jgi:flagellar hook-associated protein 1 FlgK